MCSAWTLHMHDIRFPRERKEVHLRCSYIFPACGVGVATFVHFSAVYVGLDHLPYHLRCSFFSACVGVDVCVHHFRGVFVGLNRLRYQYFWIRCCLACAELAQKTQHKRKCVVDHTAMISTVPLCKFACVGTSPTPQKILRMDGDHHGTPSHPFSREEK